MQVIKADPYNSYGYKAPALNNLGVLYESLGDLNNAKACYEYALQACPTYDMAKQNLKSVKAQRRSKRWSTIGNILGTVGETLGTMSNSQAAGTYGTYQENGSSYSGSSSGSSTGSSMCKRCHGSGKCSSMSGTATNTIAMVLVNAVIVTVAALYVILVRTLSVQLVTDVENAVTAMVQVNAPIATAQERDNDNRLYHTLYISTCPPLTNSRQWRVSF